MTVSTPTTTTDQSKLRKKNSKTPPQAPNNNQQTVNLLILNPSPRHIKIFEAKLQKLNTKYDILRIKNDFEEKRAYNTGRDWFLQHPEYTHLAILPDDLLVDVKHVDKLVEDLELYDYDVLSGISNFSMESANFFNNMTAIDYRNYGAVDQLRKTGRFDYFKQIMSRVRYKEIKEEMKNKPNRIIRVAMSMFPFTIIKRHVVEKIEFGHNLMGVDTVFFQDCIKNNISTYADLDVELWHIKGIEDNKQMQESILMAFDRNISTAINYVESNKPEREEIFLPKVQELTV